MASSAEPEGPNPGDTVHVVGHGPAVLLEVAVAGRRGRLKYKVRYPDGSHYHIAREQILVHEAMRSLGSPAAPGPPSPRGPRRLEYLGRAFDDASRGISTPSATFSLVATMVGGGVLSLPYAMSQSGLIFGTFALLAAAAASAWTLDMLVDCARATGRDTFELVGHAAFGESCRKATVVLVLVICWLTQIAYFVLLADLLLPVVQLCLPQMLTALSAQAARRVVVSLAAVLLSPMCFKSSLSALRFLCFASVGSVVLVGAMVMYRALEHVDGPHVVQRVLPDSTTELVTIPAEYALWPADWLKALYVFPMFGVSFLCHFNALPTHQELQRPTRWRMRRVLALTVAFTSLLYLLVSVFGYLYAGECTCGNILLNFRQRDRLVAVGRAALGAVLMLNFPLICQPCRKALYRLLADAGCMGRPAAAAEPGAHALTAPCDQHLNSEGPPINGDGAGAGAAAPRCDSLVLTAEELPALPPLELPPSGPPSCEVEPSGAPGAREVPARVHVYRREDTRGSMQRGSTLEAYDSFMPKDETVQQSAGEPTLLQRCGLTALLLGSSLLVSCFMQSILVVWSVLGSTVAFLMAFILPAAFWYQIVGRTSQPWRRRAAAALLVISTVLAVCCTVLTCLNLDAPPCPLTRVDGQRQSS